MTKRYYVLFLFAFWGGDGNGGAAHPPCGARRTKKPPRRRPGKQEIRGQTVRWPVSRVLFRFPGDGYSSSAAVAGRVEQPTRTAAQDRACRAGRHVSLHGLAPDGVYHARPVAGPAVRSYRTFSPLPPESGGLFSVALSLGSPRRALPGILILWSPDFPLPEPQGVGQQPSGHLTAPGS